VGFISSLRWKEYREIPREILKPYTYPLRRISKYSQTSIGISSHSPHLKMQTEYISEVMWYYMY